MHCPRCGHVSSDDQIYCNSCGAKLSLPEFDSEQLFENIAINSGVMAAEDDLQALEHPVIKKRVKPGRRPAEKRKSGLASSFLLLGVFSIMTSVVIAGVYMLFTHNQASAINRFAEAVATVDVEEIRENALFNGFDPTDEQLENMASSFTEDDILQFKKQLDSGESRDYSAFSIAEVALTWPFKSYVVTVDTASVHVNGITSDTAVTVDGATAVTEFSQEGVCIISGLVPGTYNMTFGAEGTYQSATVVTFKDDGEPLQAVAIGPVVEEPEPTPEPEPVPEPEPEPTPEPEIPEGMTNQNDILFHNISTAIHGHYSTYLLSQTNGDMSLLTYSTEAAKVDALDRYNNYNSGNSFEFVSMKVDRDTIVVNTVDGVTTADILVEVVFTSAPSDDLENKTQTTSNLMFHLIMQPNTSWLVDSRTSSEATVGSNVIVF